MVERFRLKGLCVNKNLRPVFKSNIFILLMNSFKIVHYPISIFLIFHNCFIYCVV